MGSSAFDRARAAVLQLWDRAKREGTEDVLTDDMLVVADALEEAGLIDDADWLRATYEDRPTRRRNGHLVFIGQTRETIQSMQQPGNEHEGKATK